MVTTKLEYGRELFQELKRARGIARQQAQISQNEQYDKHSKETKITVGDLVMFKVEPTCGQDILWTLQSTQYYFYVCMHVSNL